MRPIHRLHSMNLQEKIAIVNLRKAISDAHRIGIRLAGMDSQLLYATKSAFAKGREHQQKEEKRLGSCYSAVAHAVQIISDASAGTLDDECYEDSGGW